MIADADVWALAVEIALLHCTALCNALNSPQLFTLVAEPKVRTLQPFPDPVSGLGANRLTAIRGRAPLRTPPL